MAVAVKSAGKPVGYGTEGNEVIDRLRIFKRYISAQLIMLCRPSAVIVDISRYHTKLIFRCDDVGLFSRTLACKRKEIRFVIFIGKYGIFLTLCPDGLFILAIEENRNVTAIEKLLCCVASDCRCRKLACRIAPFNRYRSAVGGNTVRLLCGNRSKAVAADKL